MFSSGMLESTQERVQICGVEPEVLSLLVNYVYTSKVSITQANVQVRYSHHTPGSFILAYIGGNTHVVIVYFAPGPACSIKLVGGQGC